MPLMTPVPVLMDKPGGRPLAVKELAVRGGLVPTTVMALMAVPTDPMTLAVGEAVRAGEVETTGVALG